MLRLMPFKFDVRPLVSELHWSPELWNDFDLRTNHPASPHREMDDIIVRYNARVNFNGTGTVAIRASSNVSSITDNGTGDYTVNFTTAMTDANYAMSGYAGDALFSVGVVMSSWGVYTQTTSAFRLKVYYGSNTVVDTTNVLATFIR